MKRLLVLLLALAALLTGCADDSRGTVAVVSPSSQLYVTDDADILSSETENDIVDRVTRLQEACGGEIAVVTIDFLTNGLDSEEYTYELFNQWGVGDADENNGTVLLLVPGEGKGWCAAGSGIEDSLTAGRLETILNTYLWDDFDAGRYDEAVINTVDALLDWYESYYSIDLDAVQTAQPPAQFGGGAAPHAAAVAGRAVFQMFGIVIAVVVVALVVLCTAGSAVGRRRGGWLF